MINVNSFPQIIIYQTKFV